MFTKGLFLSEIVHKFVKICASEHFSFAEIIQHRKTALQDFLIVASLRYTERLDVPHLFRSIDLDKPVNDIWKKETFFEYIEKKFWIFKFSSWKWGQKQKCWVDFLFSVNWTRN